MLRAVAVLLAVIAAAPAAPARAQGALYGWRSIEGLWRVAEGDERCPGNETWTYAISDDGQNLVFWAQGFLAEPISIPDRLGNPPRIQGRAPFYNTRILSRGGNRLRNRHETLTVEADRLTVDYGNFRCYAVRIAD